jgi:hypothetical protein
LNHRVALDNDPNPALPPAAVEVDEFGRGDAVARYIFVAPVAETFGHRSFEELVWGCAAGESEGDGLAEQLGCRHRCRRRIERREHWIVF